MRLEQFDVANGGLGDDGMVLLAGALQSSPHLFPNLSTLMFYGNEVGPRGIKALAKALQQGACPCLEHLNINANPICDEGLVALVEAMQAGAPCNATLRELLLRHCEIGWAGARVYLEAWDEGWMSGIWVHCLDSNPLGVEGIRALCGMYLNEKLRWRHYLCVDYSGDDTADALLDALRSNPKPDPPYTLPLINDLAMELEALQEDSADDDGAEGREGK